jgi:hypothetical protein
VLEPGRSLTLAEKGGAGAELVVGAAGFLVLATMNPGGDFGKKELSPALSNRFTQVRGHNNSNRDSNTKFCSLRCMSLGFTVALTPCAALVRLLRTLGVRLRSGC